MINQKESKQVRLDSWLFNLLSRGMKAKAKVNNHKNHRIIIGK